MMNQAIALISELVSIDHGKYIVKVTVNSQGVILGTGLAAAETIEIAEDRARERALAIINLTVSVPSTKAIDFSTSSSSKPSESVHNSVNPSIPETKIETKINSQTESTISLTDKSTRKNQKQSPISLANQSQSTSKLEITPISSDSELTLNLNESVKETPENQSPSTQPENNSLTDNLNQSENQPTLPLEFPSETREIIELPIVKFADSNEIESSIIQSDEQTETDIFNSESELNLTFSDTPEEESAINLHNNLSDNIPEIIDFNQIIDQTAIEMKRLNWSQEQGKKYLLETYGKKSRHLLSDEELIEFLNYLKKQ